VKKDLLKTRRKCGQNLLRAKGFEDDELEGFQRRELNVACSPVYDSVLKLQEKPRAGIMPDKNQNQMELHWNMRNPA
jgi:hypothetical protein